MKKLKLLATRFRAWIYRQLYWSKEQRAEFKLDEDLAKHPTRRALEAKIRNAQVATGGYAEGTFVERWDASERVSDLIAQYESARDELKRRTTGDRSAPR